jgi:hypothetical protein
MRVLMRKPGGPRACCGGGGGGCAVRPRTTSARLGAPGPCGRMGAGAGAGAVGGGPAGAGAPACREYSGRVSPAGEGLRAAGEARNQLG